MFEYGGNQQILRDDEAKNGVWVQVPPPAPIASDCSKTLKAGNRRAWAPKTEQKPEIRARRRSFFPAAQV